MPTNPPNLPADLERISSLAANDLRANQELITALTTQINTLDDRNNELSDELRLANQTLSDKDEEIASLSSLLDQGRDEIETLRQQVTTLEAEIVELKKDQPTKPPVPPTPPIEVAPDISISSFFGTFRPPLKGQKLGRETRYTGTFNGDDLGIILDIKDDGQIAVCIDNCLGPVGDIPIDTNMKVTLGLAIYNLGSFRLHSHTRPRFLINPSKPPTANVRDLISKAFIPNYDLSVSMPETDLAKIADRRHPWDRWTGGNKPYDPITEEFGLSSNSWSGGAGALLNEAHHLSPIQVVYLLTQDPRAWEAMLQLALSSGNYAIHYKLSSDAAYSFPTASETSTLPFLQTSTSVTIKTAAGITCSIPEPAHEHSLTYLAYLLTGERWYLEELQAWTTYNTLTRPKNDLRYKGIIWSGQIRAAAWSLRALLHLANCGDTNAQSELRANLDWMNSTFLNPANPDHRTTGVCAVHDYRWAPLLDFIRVDPKPKYFSTWNHHIMASVLNECVRAGYTDAAPMRDHLTRVVRGVWESSPSRYDIGWGNHAFPADDWSKISAVTFAGRELPTKFTPPTFPTQTTPDYIAWARSSIVAAVDSGQTWAVEALKWVDTEAAKYKGGVPLGWKIQPSR